MAKPKTNNSSSGVRYDADTRKRVRTLARRGKSVPEIRATLAESSDTAPTQKTIREWLGADGIEVPAARQRQHNRDKILRDLKATKRDGATPKFTRAQIQEKYGCSAKFLSQLASGKLAS